MLLGRILCFGQDKNHCTVISVILRPGTHNQMFISLDKKKKKVKGCQAITQNRIKSELVWLCSMTWE